MYINVPLSHVKLSGECMVLCVCVWWRRQVCSSPGASISCLYIPRNADSASLLRWLNATTCSREMSSSIQDTLKGHATHNKTLQSIILLHMLISPELQMNRAKFIPVLKQRKTLAWSLLRKTQSNKVSNARKHPILRQIYQRLHITASHSSQHKEMFGITF